MEIILKRIARKDAYTIGHLYILKDGEVTRKVNCAMMNPHLKRWFTSTFDHGLLKGETYFCDTLEPTWRNLLGVELKPEERMGDWDVCRVRRRRR